MDIITRTGNLIPRPSGTTDQYHLEYDDNTDSYNWVIPELNTLSDVNITTLNPGDVLTYNGTNWVADTPAAGSGFTLVGETGTPQTIEEGDTLTVATGQAFTSTVSSVDTLTIDFAVLPTTGGITKQVLQFDDTGDTYSWVDISSSVSATWYITDGVTSQNIDSGNTLTITEGTGISALVSATDTLTIGMDAVISDLNDVDTTGVVEGSVLYYNGTNWVDLAPGVPSQVLTVNGTATAPEWTTPSTGSSFTLTADSGISQVISAGDTMTISGGNGVFTIGSATDTVTTQLEPPTTGGVTIQYYSFDDNTDSYSWRDIASLTDLNGIYTGSGSLQVGTTTATGLGLGYGMSFTGLETFNVNSVSGIGTATITANTVTLITGSTSLLVNNTGIVQSQSPYTYLKDIPGNATAPSLRFYEGSGGTDYVAFKAADTLATTTLYTLPSSDGSSGQVLQTDGGGLLSWVTPASGTFTNLFLAGDAGTIQTLTDGNTIRIFGGSGIITTTSATDTLTVALSASINQLLDVSAGAAVNGSVLYYSGGTWINLNPGSPGQVLTLNGTATGVQWSTVSGGGGGTMSSFTINADSNTGSGLIEDGEVLTITGGDLLMTSRTGTASVAGVDISIDTTGASPGDVITYNGTIPIWSAPSGGAGSNGLFDLTNEGATTAVNEAVLGVNLTFDGGETYSLGGTDLSRFHGSGQTGAGATSFDFNLQQTGTYSLETVNAFSANHRMYNLFSGMYFENISGGSTSRLQMTSGTDVSMILTSGVQLGLDTNRVIVKTPNVVGATASVGQVLQLVNAGTGEVEFATVAAGGSTDYVQTVAYDNGTKRLNFTGIGSAYNSFVDLTALSANDISYVSNVQLIGTDLTFSKVGSAYSGSISLAGLDTSIYKANGTITSARTVNGGGFALTFSNSSNITLTANSALTLNGTSTTNINSGSGGINITSNTGLNKVNVTGTYLDLLADTKLRLYNGAGSTVSIQTSGSFTSYGLVLPTTDGNVNQVLTTDGSGILSWTDKSGTDTSIYTDNGTLSSNRTVTGNSKSFSFTGTSGTTITSTGTATFGSTSATNITSGIAGANLISAGGISLIAGAGYNITVDSDNLILTDSTILKLRNTSLSSIGIQPPTGVWSNYTLTLPNNDGTSSQVLTTDGSGVLSWTDNIGDTNGMFDVSNDGGTWQVLIATLGGDTTLLSNSDSFKISGVDFSGITTRFEKSSLGAWRITTGSIATVGYTAGFQNDFTSSQFYYSTSTTTSNIKTTSSGSQMAYVDSVTPSDNRFILLNGVTGEISLQTANTNAGGVSSGYIPTVTGVGAATGGNYADIDFESIGQILTDNTSLVVGATSADAETNAGIAGVTSGEAYRWDDGDAIHVMLKK